jgi:hypothetical protein
MHRVRDRLATLIASGSHSLVGLHWYVTIVGEFIDIFVSNHHSVWERARKASLVAHSFILWKASIIHCDHLNIKEHFLTNQTFVDVLIVLHGVVNLMAVAKDMKCEPLQLERTGSDACESLFLKLGSQQVAQRSFTALEAHRTVGRMNAAAILVADDSVNMFKVHSKRDVIWNRNYPNHGSKPMAISHDRLPTRDELRRAWEEGLKEAIDRLEKLTVLQAEETMVTDSCFTCGNTLNSSIRNWMDEDEVLSELDDDAKQDSASVHFHEDDVDDIVAYDAVAADIVAHDEDEQIKVLSTVDGPNDMGKVNINLLVSLLNHNHGGTSSNISSDRLTRVRSRYEDALASNRMPNDEELRAEKRVIYPGTEVVCIIQDANGPRMYVGTVFRIVDRQAKFKILSWFDLRTLTNGAHGPMLLIKFKEPIQNRWYEFVDCDKVNYASEVVAASVLFRITLLYDIDREVYVVDEAYRKTIQDELDILIQADTTAKAATNKKKRKK